MTDVWSVAYASGSLVSSTRSRIAEQIVFWQRSALQQRTVDFAVEAIAEGTRCLGR